MMGKIASVPHTSPTAQWDGKMLKVLVGQGQLYVRLLRDCKVVRATTLSSDDDFDDAPLLHTLSNRCSSSKAGSSSASVIFCLGEGESSLTASQSHSGSHKPSVIEQSSHDVKVDGTCTQPVLQETNGTISEYVAGTTALDEDEVLTTGNAAIEPATPPLGYTNSPSTSTSSELRTLLFSQKKTIIICARQ